MDVFTRNYGLFLSRHGVQGEILCIFDSMYRQLKSCVKVEGGLTDCFQCNIETR